MSREEFKGLLSQLNNPHFYSEGEEVSKILAEYDRLTAEVELLKQERDAYSERLHELRMEQVCHDCPI